MTIPTQVDLSKYIDMRDGRPNVRGRRLPVMFIVSAERERNLTISEIAEDYTISTEQVLAALLYYQEHKAEMDAQDAEDLEASRRWHEQHGGMPGKR